MKISISKSVCGWVVHKYLYKNRYKHWYWLSFVDPSLQKGEQFLGVAIVRGYHIIEAVASTHRQGINPGGEVRSMRIDSAEAHLVPCAWRNVLLNRADCAKLDQFILNIKKETK